MSDEDKTIEEIRAEEDAAMEKVYDHAEENLAALRDDLTPEPEPEPTPEPEPDPEPESDPQPEGDEPEPEPEPESEPEPAGDEPEAEPADEHALTAAEVRAAIHTGWTQEDIDELAEANPGLAKKTCAKALESQNNLSKKFSELGKTQATKEEPAVPATPAPAPQPKSAIDFTALEKEYENDPIVGVLKQVVEQNQNLAAEIGTLREAGPRADDAVAKAQAQHDAAVAQQIDSFFERPDVAEYKDTYGEVEKGSKDWDNLTQGQIKKRYEVAEQANLIMLGAEKQGVEMPLEEAFERAHLLVTEDVREQTIRKSIKAKAVKRQKSLTLEPTGSKKVASKVKTMAEVEANAERMLQKLRGK